MKKVGKREGKERERERKIRSNKEKMIMKTKADGKNIQFREKEILRRIKKAE